MRRSRGAPVVRVLLALVLTAALAPAALAAPQNSREAREQLSDTRSELEDAKGDLHVVTARVQQAQSELSAVDARLATAQEQLRALEAKLQKTTAEHLAAQQRLDAVKGQLIAATAKLEETRAALKAREDLFGARVSATYKYGTISYAQVLVDSKDFNEFLNSYYYVRSALEFDQGLIEQVTGLAKQQAAERAEVARLRDSAQDQEAQTRSAREQVAALAAEQRAQTQAVAADRRQREALVTSLEASKQQYQRLVADLEAESASLAAELRRIEEKERARSSSGGWTAGATPGAGELAWPTNGRVTSGYGYRRHPIYGSQRMHTGVDIPGPTGQAIVSAADGYVVSAGWRGGYGLAVVISHGGGLATLYAHMSTLSVSEGDTVSKAQHIGGIGTTGQSTGPHLHFEVRVNGNPRDPMQWYR